MRFDHDAMIVQPCVTPVDVLLQRLETEMCESVGQVPFAIDVPDLPEERTGSGLIGLSRRLGPLAGAGLALSVMSALSLLILARLTGM